jgi:UDP-glucose 4-epimerase
VANPKRSQQTLRFKAVHSDLARIIRSSWNWHQNAHPLKLALSSGAASGVSDHATGLR